MATPKISSTKSSRIVVGNTHYKLEPAATRTHYGEHRTIGGGQPFAFPVKRADDAWFVVSGWDGKKHGLVQRWGDGEWTFSKIEAQQQTPNWLRAQFREVPASIVNLSSRLYSGATPEEAISQGLGQPRGTSHATRKRPSKPSKISVRKVGARWQPVDGRGHVVRGAIYNADGTGYSSKEGAAEAASMLRQLRERG